MNYVERFLDKFQGVVSEGDGRWKALCPLHGDSSPSLGISLGEDGRLLVNCLVGCQREEIRKKVGFEWRECYCPDDESPVVGEVALRGKGEDIPLPEAKWDTIYGSFLAYLGLNKEHSKLLKERGLTLVGDGSEAYRTLSYVRSKQAISNLLNQYSEEELLLTPGFRRDPKTSKIEVSLEAGGLLIPVRGLDGKILALKVRQDRSPKYVWFSGGGSPSCGSPCHYSRGSNPSSTVRIVEGPLKADVVTALSPEIQTLGVGGVSNWKGALPLLKALGASKVFLAFDMDWRVNPGVAGSLKACGEALVGLGYEVLMETWDPAFKGPDDIRLTNGTWLEERWAKVLPEISRAVRGSENVILPNVPPKAPQTSTKASGGLEVVRASDVGLGVQEWLWESWLPKGTLVLLEGEAAVGKGLVALNVVSRYTLGVMAEGATRTLPGNVLILSTEDSQKNTLNPRLMAAGADLRRVFYPKESVSLPQDLEVLGRMVQEYGVGLILFDPLNAYLSPEVDCNSDVSLRTALSPMFSWLESSGVVALAIRHFNKASGMKALHRGLGSVAYGAQARVEMAVIPHEGALALVQIKNNLARKPKGLAFCVTEESVKVGDLQVKVPRVVWRGEVEGDIDSLMGVPEPRGMSGIAEEILGQMLPCPMKEVKRVCEEAGVGLRTLEKVKKTLGITSRLNYDQDVPGRHYWLWEFPHGEDNGKGCEG